MNTLNTQNSNRNEIEEGRLTALFSYIPFLCFIPLISNIKNDFAKKHAKQGLLLLIIEIIALLFLIDFFSHVFWVLVLLLCSLLAIFGIFRVLLGRRFTIPFIGNIFEKYEI